MLSSRVLLKFVSLQARYISRRLRQQSSAVNPGNCANQFVLRTAVSRVQARFFMRHGNTRLSQVDCQPFSASAKSHCRPGLGGPTWQGVSRRLAAWRAARAIGGENREHGDERCAHPSRPSRTHITDDARSTNAPTRKRAGLRNGLLLLCAFCMGHISAMPIEIV